MNITSQGKCNARLLYVERSCVGNTSSHAGLFALLTLVFCLLLPARAQSSFTPGNVVIYRVGDGSGPLVNTGNPVFLDEFSPAGTLVQSIPMPYSTSFSTARPGATIAYVRSALVASGSAVEEIGISRSADGRFLILTGYDTAIPCDRPLTATHAYDVGRVIARVDHSGGVNISTVLTDLPSNVTPYAAVSDNGSRFWLAGSGGKIHYVPFGAATTTEIAEGVSGLRNLAISNEQLFASRNMRSSAISRVGTGLPSTVDQSLVPLSLGLATDGDPRGFFFADLSEAEAGPDTLYVADESRGLRKFSLSAGIWSLTGEIGTGADDYRGLTATVVEDEVTLYATRRAFSISGGGELVKIVDSSGFGGVLSGVPSVLATAAANTSFRGIALTPEPLPDLSVEVSAPAGATMGAPFDYTFTVRNNGAAAATGITVRFHVPSGLVVEAGPDADSFIGPGAAENEPVVEFIDGTLAPGGTATLVLTVSADTTGTVTAPVQAAVVDPDNWIIEGDESNNGSPMAAITVVSSTGPEPTTFTWASSVGGNWSDGTKWINDKNDGSTPQSAGAANYELNFNNPTGYSYKNDLSTDFVLNRLNFGGNDVRLLGQRIEFIDNGLRSPQIRQNNGNVASIEAPIRFMSDLTFTGPGDGTVTLAGELSGDGGLIKRGPGILALTATNTYAGNTTIYSGTLALTGSSGMKQLISEGSFEKPPFGAEGWSYNTNFTGWEIHGPAGVASSYTPWVDVPPDGNQVAFLQDTQEEQSSISQEVNVETSGQYRLSFQVANRPGYSANGLIFKVDGLPVASWSDVEIQSDGYFFELTFTTSLFAGSHLIEFVGSNTANNGDVATVIDNISLVGPIGKLPGGTKVMLQTEGSTLDIGGTEQAFDSLAGVAGSTVINNGKLTLNPSGPPSSFDGTMTGSGSVVKAGPGIVGLNGVIAYSGDTIVEEGSLRCTSTNPNNDASHVFINYGATLNLDFDGVETVGSFDVGESSMSPGYYNASNSSGTITGTGTLLVVGATPEIVVTHANEELANGAAINFGIVVEGVPGDDVRVLVIRNTGRENLDIDASPPGGGGLARPGAAGSSGGSVANVSDNLLSGPAAGDYHIKEIGFDDEEPNILRLYPGGIGYFVISFTPGAPGLRDATLAIPSNDPDESGFTLQLAGGSPQAPVFVVQPEGLAIDANTALVLDCDASGVPAPTYQWYQGDSGDDTNPVPGATLPSFTTPVLNTETHYWVQATNPYGTADSDTAVVTIKPPSLAEIGVSVGAKFGFLPLDSGDTLDFGNWTVTSTQYVSVKSMLVDNSGFDSLENLRVTVTGPDAENFDVNLDGIPNPFTNTIEQGSSGLFSVYMAPKKEGLLNATLNIFSNDADENPFTLSLTGYGINPTATLSATGVTQTSAHLNGSSDPYGVSTTAQFEYGLTTGYGSTVAVTLSPDDGMGPQFVTAEILGLQPGTTYHYRLVTNNSFEATSGGDWTFTTPSEWSDFTYMITDDQVTITGYTGPGGDVVIPSIIEGFPVVAIGDSVFYNNDTITSVVIPEGVYGIGQSAFAYCRSLTSVTIPNSTIFIASQAFSGCSSIAEIFIPANVTYISTFAFDSMTSLTGFTVDPNNPDYSSLDGVLFNKDQTSLLVFPGGLSDPYVVPASVTRIEDHAFYFCSALSGVTLPEGLQSIGYGAFVQCDSLGSLIIPSSVSMIRPGSISECNALQSITVTEPNENYTSQDGVLFNDDLTTLIQYPAGKSGSYNVPASVTRIAGVAFINTDGLTGITLPAGLTEIGISAFYSCDNLPSIDIPSGVTSLGHTTFAYCASMTSVTFHEGLLSLGEYAFYSCTSLTSVNFPSTVIAIGKDAFRYCFNLASVVFRGEAPSSIDAEAFGSSGGGFFIGYFDPFAAGFAQLPWTNYATQNLGNPAPEIRVDEPIGTEVAMESFRSFGTGPVGENINTKTFVVTNNGYAALENLDVSVVGTHADDFTLDLSSFPTSLASGASAQFTISFTPGAAGSRNAVLSITSNDPDENPFVSDLFGTGTTQHGLGENLLTNGDAESGSGSVGGYDVIPAKGWSSAANATVVQYGASGFPTNSSPGPAIRGLNFFAGGPSNNVSSFTQTILLDDVAVDVSTGQVAFELSGFLGGYDAQADNTVVTAEFLGDDDGLIASAAIGPVSNDQRGNISGMLYRAIQGEVPAGTLAIRVTVVFTRSNGVYNDGYADNLSLVLREQEAPSIITQPESRAIANGTSAELFVEASAVPAPVYQWYQGESGNTLNPVDGATSANFSSPALVSTRSYWVRVTNPQGSVDSNTATITVATPSATNAYLSDLRLSNAALSPAFDPLIGIYSASVASSVSSITITPTLVGVGATMRVNGQLVSSGSPNRPVRLDAGINVITTVVTAGTGGATRTYTVTVTRAAPLLVTTEPAEMVDSTMAVIKGTVTPYGAATVFFEYGTTTAFGEQTEATVVSGDAVMDFQKQLSGLPGDSTFYYRSVAVNDEGTFYGVERSFTTSPDAPVAATGDPGAVTNNSATLIGAVDPKGLETVVVFQYGTTNLYGNVTPPQIVPPGTGIVDIVAPNAGLIPNSTYHYRIVASNAAGDAIGEDVVFNASAGGVPSTSPTAKPNVDTGAAVAIGTQSATLLGLVNPNQGTTVAQFEYGTTASYGRKTKTLGVGNGNTIADVALPVDDIAPGTTVHYRLLASNSLGMSAGEDRTFTTKSPSPTAVTGEAEILTTTKARLNGWAHGNGNSANAFFDYGTDGVTFPSSISALPANVTGNINTAVHAELQNLSQGVTYYYRVRAEGANGSGTGEIKSLKIALLSGLIQRFPSDVPLADRQGSVTVTLHPDGIGSGWRFAGELSWRLSGIPATGLTSGDRVIEYRPVAGHVQPTSETVSVVSAPPEILLDRNYTASAATGTGDLTVTLKPESLAGGSVPVANRLQWRLFGENDAQWKDSGTTVSGLVAGNHLIECKAVPSRATPPASSAMIEENQSATSTITYFLNQETIGAAPGVLTFQVVSASADQPYAYCGQIRSDVGAGSGFVVGPRVVATAGHVVFDDGALATATGLQWLFQRDRDIHEPRVLLPRGYYLMTGYAAQRAADNSPGTSTPQSQNLDAASLYFSEDAGRGGYSGYLASDSTSNEFILSSAVKTLVGYPLDGIAEQDRDKMHATPKADVRFSQAFARTYTTSDIRSAGGNSGGPLCVQYQNGNFYPAAIYLGGTAQTVVRAIDSDVVELFGFAETSGRSGVGDAGGSLRPISRTPIATPTLGALQVMIEPAAARNAGGGWRIRSQSPFRAGGYQENNLNPNSYTVEFATVAGYVPPARQTVGINAGELASFSFTYEKIILPPVINSPDSVTGVRGSTLEYQITALNSPELFSLQGVLPAGMTFGQSNGLISGIPTEAGRFIVTTGANNSGGADSRVVTLTSLPVLNPQSFTVPYNQPMSYQITSSESGNGVVFAATNLPQGLSLNPASGQISGTPAVAGTFPIPISVTIRNATATSVLTLRITDTPPVFTLQPVATRTIAYAASTTLKAAADGLPAPTFQWYQGESGVTDSPIQGATSAMFTTPSLTAATKYWVRASSISGSADSTTSAISLLPSTNANLAGLLLSSGSLSPAFNAGIASYAANVGNAVPTIQITPAVEVGQSTVKINGSVTTPGAPSAPLALATGPNLFSIEVTAGDGTTKKTYLISVGRLAPASITTGGALNLTDVSATIRGTVIPNGNATVFFQYGRTTSYGSTTSTQDVSGITPLVFQSVLQGLQGDTEYHFRSAVTTAAGTFFGEDAMFRTAVNSPLVATGDAVDVTLTDALLLGAVDTNNIETEVYFEYGPTAAYGFNTPHGIIPAGVGVVDISHTVTGVNASYHYRLVAINAAGMAFGDDVILGTGGGSKIDSSKPDAATGDSSDITTGSAILQGLVNPHNRTTLVSFEYGLTNSYGSRTSSRGVGNGNTAITVAQMADGLLPGTTYHYRVSAANSHGTTLGEDRTFTTAPLAPAAVTGDTEALTATTARIHGMVKARGANTLVSFEYGTDGMNFPNSANANPANVTGDAEMPVSLDIANLDELVTYHYRIRASNSGGTTLGEIRTLRTGSLQGLVQDFAREVPADDRQGQLTVNILPTGIGGWRFIGDTFWRNSGDMVASLTTGEREIEFRPVAGYIQPQNEFVGVVSGEATQVLDRIYYDSAVAGTGALKVFLLPESITGPGISLPSRAQWRIVGDSTWIDSGAERTGFAPGSYLVECKSVLGKNTPSPVNALVAQGATKTISISYFPASAPSLNPPGPIPFSTVSTSENLPYGYVGQIRSGTGSYSGFVVKPRVVVTVAQAIFDDATLSATSGTQWLLQRDRGTYEPTPQAPRGYYLFSGYDAQRTIEASPGLLSLQSQDLNVAALYFAADAGRGGFSGFLASDAEPNEFLTSTSLKTLVGYPVNGVSTANQGRMHATAPATATMTLALGRTYRTSQIRGMGGMFGGPFCVQKDGGAFYPAGVFVGGTTQSLIRAIDGNMIDLFTRAEVSGNGGDNNTGGGITHSSFTSIGTASQPGALKINILPEAAISAGRWSISPETTLRTSGAQKGNLAPGTYVIKFNTVAGFQVPAQQRITISGGQLSNLTYTFESSTTPQESWRLTNFNSTANAGIAADDADPDGDGARNRDEYAAGTNPNNAADMFKVLTMTRTTGLFSVSVLGKKDRTYVLERTSSLNAASWSAVKSIGPLASDQPITLSDAAPPVDQGFYQVRVTSP